MAKSYKIKRYRHIYRKRRFSPIKAGLLLLLLAVLAFVGFSLYEPVHDFWSGKLLQRMESSSSAPEEQPEPSSQQAESLPQASEPEMAPLSGIHALYIPEEVLLSGEILPYLQNHSLPDINTVLVDLKNSAGQVLYQSHVEFVAEAGSQHAQAIDLPEVVAALQAAGYQTAGRICAFRDPVAPYAHETAAVKYENTEWTWLDNSQEAGGRPWLNPYSPVAQDYIGDLANEAVGMGIPLILIDNLQFPEGLGLDRATFGEWAASQSKADVLQDFAEKLQARLLPQGAAAIPCVSGIHLLGQNLSLPYDATNPAAIFTTSALSVQMMPALFGEVFEAEGFRLQAPATTPYETTQAVAGRALATLSEGTQLLPWIQGYTAQNLSGDFNRTYTEEEVSEQIRALREAGVDSYILVY